MKESREGQMFEDRLAKRAKNCVFDEYLPMQWKEIECVISFLI